MILGKPTKLESQFRLTYNMILNLLRVEALKIEEMIKRSFSENSAQKLLPEQQKQLTESTRVLENMNKLNCNICLHDIHEYYETSSRIMLINHELREMFINTPVGSKALAPGRVCIVNNTFYRNTVAVLLSIKTFASRAGESKSFSLLVLSKSRSDILVPASESELAPLPITVVDIPEIGFISHEIVTVVYTDIAVVTKFEMKLDLKEDLIPNTAEAISIEQRLFQIAKEMKDAGHLFEFDWGKLRDIEFQERLKEKDILFRSLSRYDCIHCLDLNDHYSQIHIELKLQQQVANLAHNISDQNLELLPDYFQRLEVLKQLDFIGENSTVQLKGRVACEINTADELVLTELILDNFFAEFEPAEIVALLSCFVFQEKSQSTPSLTLHLQCGVDKIKKTTSKIADLQRQCGLNNRQEDSLKFGLVEVVYEWAKGLPFKHITELTDVLEGSIVRCIVRLDETCRECRGAARLIGDVVLFKKMEEASELIKRDIVFAASLYF